MTSDLTPGEIAAELRARAEGGSEAERAYFTWLASEGEKPPARVADLTAKAGWMLAGRERTPLRTSLIDDAALRRRGRSRPLDDDC